MAKKMISRLSVLVVLMVFLAACSDKSEYTNAIPADATVLVTINFKSLADKAGVNDKESAELTQKALDALKSEMNAATFQQLEKVMKSPKESGIDTDSPCYIFTSPTFQTPTFVAKVINENNLHTSLDVMAKEQICEPVAEADGYSFTVVNGNLLAFNATTAVIATGIRSSMMEATNQAIANLMKQTSENSISQSGAFQKMSKQKNDVNFFTSLAAIPQPYRSQASLGLPTEVKPEDLIIIAGLNFEKGKITLKTENYSENDAVKAIIKKQQEAMGKANNTFLKYFPASSLMFFNAGIKGEGLYNMLSDNEEFRKTISMAKAAEMKEVFSSFNGDISGGLINFTMSNAPTFLMYAEVKNASALEALYKNKKEIGLKRGQDIVELGKDEYVFKTRGMNVFFGVKDNQMYATNDELLYKNIGKAVDKSVKDAPYASDMKGKNGFMAVNFEAIMELPVVKMFIGFGGQQAKTYSELADKFSYMSVSAEGDASVLDLCMKDKDTNALKQMVDFAKQFAGM